MIIWEKIGMRQREGKGKEEREWGEKEREKRKPLHISEK